MPPSPFEIGYAYKSQFSYLDHLRIADSAREAQSDTVSAIKHSSGQVESAITDASAQITTAIDELADAVRDTSSEISAELSNLGGVMEWGFSSLLNAQHEMNTSIKELIVIAKNPSKTWCYEQIEIARTKFRRPLYDECLKRLEYAVNGHQTHLGLPEEWRFHQLMGDIYLQCKSREFIDLPKAEQCFQAVVRYADDPNVQSVALTAAAVSAYNQGRMQEAEDYAKRACAKQITADGCFQLSRILLYRGKNDAAWEAALQSISLDRRYAVRVPLDAEFRRHASWFESVWDAYRQKLRSRIEADLDGARKTIQKLTRSLAEVEKLNKTETIVILQALSRWTKEISLRITRT